MVSKQQEKNMQYVIMRGVKNTSFQYHPLPQEVHGKTVKRVWFLIDEAKFLANNGVAVHHQNAFLEDKYHDWEQKGDTLRYYAHSSAPDDVVDIIVYFE
jgi:hypothetical protein